MPENSNEQKEPSLRLEVGKKYWTRGNVVVEVIHISSSPDNDYPVVVEYMHPIKMKKFIRVCGVDGNSLQRDLASIWDIVEEYK